MIDEKKIEKEAVGYTQDGYNSYNSETQELIEEGFKAGAHWAIQEFLKELWHDASEVPKETNYIAQYHDGDFFDVFQNNFEWEQFVKEIGITRWCYIDDLLEQKGGKK